MHKQMQHGLLGHSVAACRGHPGTCIQYHWPSYKAFHKARQEKQARTHHLCEAGYLRNEDLTEEHMLRRHGASKHITCFCIKDTGLLCMAVPHLYCDGGSASSNAFSDLDEGVCSVQRCRG